MIKPHRQVLQETIDKHLTKLRDYSIDANTNQLNSKHSNGYPVTKSRDTSVNKS